MRHICKGCGLNDAEVCFKTCSCHFHCNCILLNDIVHNQCPSCGASSALYLVPIEENDIRSSLNKMQTNQDDLYLSVAHTFPPQSNSMYSIVDEDANIRQGKWTDEEILFVEMLIELFKCGLLFLPNGIKLNDFLRSVFLCKSARLRKKIKNTSFCSQTFRFETKVGHARQISLSTLQNSFLNSLSGWQVSSLRFNMRRMWTSYFYMFCFENKIAGILHEDYLQSVREIETKIKRIKENRNLGNRKNAVNSLLISHTDYSTLKCSTTWKSNTIGAQWNSETIICNEGKTDIRQDFLLGGIGRKPEIVPFYVKKWIDDNCAVSDISLSPMPKPDKSCHTDTGDEVHSDLDSMNSCHGTSIEDQRSTFKYYDIWKQNSSKRNDLIHHGHEDESIKMDSS